MTYAHMSWLSVSVITNYSCAHTFESVVEAMPGLELKRLEMVNLKLTLYPYVQFASRNL